MVLKVLSIGLILFILLQIVDCSPVLTDKSNEIAVEEKNVEHRRAKRKIINCIYWHIFVLTKLIFMHYYPNEQHADVQTFFRVGPRGTSLTCEIWMLVRTWRPWSSSN